MDELEKIQEAINDLKEWEQQYVILQTYNEFAVRTPMANKDHSIVGRYGYKVLMGSKELLEFAKEMTLNVIASKKEHLNKLMKKVKV